jgi:hypothetical protein
LQRAIVPSEQDFSAIKEKRAVQKADRLAAENRIADFLTGQRECVADYRRAQPQRFELGASRILIRNDAIPPPNVISSSIAKTPPALFLSANSTELLPHNSIR